MTSININNLTKSYGKNIVLEKLSLSVNSGELFFLLGASGCGKTTLLRLIAGFEQPDSGEICLNGVDVSAVSVQKRNLSVVFQQYAIWPHLSVFENVAFPLRMAKVSEKELNVRVQQTLERLSISSVSQRMPADLSGGQQQRVGLARALVGNPPLILFDEPVSNLDPLLREQVRAEIKELQRELKFTAIYVTHDFIEAFESADRIAVLDSGKVLQVATPEKLYQSPADERVARFFGHKNILPGSIFALEESRVLVPISAINLNSDGFKIDVSITSVRYRGNNYLVSGMIKNSPHSIEFQASSKTEIGAEISIYVELEKIHRFKGPEANNGV